MFNDGTDIRHSSSDINEESFSTEDTRNRLRFFSFLEIEFLIILKIYVF